jgi:hypothetical protein
MMSDLAISIGIALGIVFLLCFVWVIGAIGFSRLRYRLRFNARGTTLEQIVASGEAGVLVFDRVYGGSSGLGSPIVWWLPYACEEVTTDDLNDAYLVRCPAAINSIEDLRKYAGELVIRECLTIEEHQSA